MAKSKDISKDESAGGKDPKGEGFDARLQRLEELVAELEGGELGLEEAMDCFAEGVKLLAGCRESLSGYEKRVEELAGEAEEGLRELEQGGDEG